MITDKQLQHIMPTLKAARRGLMLSPMIAAMIEFKITTRKRAAAFLAQVAHESVDLRYFVEIWGDTPAQRRYDVRVDLGNTPERDGDGKKYMGRGPIQTTGKANYRRAGKALNLPLVEHPELLAETVHGWRSSAFFWSANGCNELADKMTGTGDSRDLRLFDKITKKVNGGFNGRVDRQANYLDALEVLTDAQFKGELDECATLIQTTTASVTQANETQTNETQASVAQTSVAQAEASAQSGDATKTDEGSLIEEIPVTTTTVSAVGKVVKARFTARLARPIVLLWAAVEAGNVAAILGLITFVVVVGYLAYVHRDDLQRGARWILRKANKGGVL